MRAYVRANSHRSFAAQGAGDYMLVDMQQTVGIRIYQLTCLIQHEIHQTVDNIIILKHVAQKNKTFHSFKTSHSFLPPIS